LLAICFLLSAGGCAIKLVADYDSNTLEEIFKVSKEVDRFYGNLLETAEADRKYSKYAEQYVNIETDIRSLVMRNKARPLNEESTRISETILNFWVKYKQNHKEKDVYSNGMAKLDRQKFVRLFTAAAEAEKIKDEDCNVEKTGKEIGQ